MKLPGRKKLGDFFEHPVKIQPHFDVLGDPGRTNEELANAAFAIMDEVNG